MLRYCQATVWLAIYQMNKKLRQKEALSIDMIFCIQSLQVDVLKCETVTTI